jgi:hypothetical protein
MYLITYNKSPTLTIKCYLMLYYKSHPVLELFTAFGFAGRPGLRFLTSSNADLAMI